MRRTRDTEQLAGAVERLIAAIARQRGTVGGEPSQLTTTQGLALGALADAGSLRLGGLAELIGTTDATASRTVDALESAGLARRAPDPTDGRGIHVEPTSRGRREVEARRERLAALLAELIRGLGAEEERRFVQLLTGLNEVLRQS